MLRQKQRTYRRNKILDIESMNCTDHREFWQNINKLGPKKCNRIPNTVYKDGLICGDEEYVLDKWRTDFESLYNPPSEIDNEFDNTFRQNITTQIELMEGNMNTENDSNIFLNDRISYDEVEKVISKLEK